MPVSIQKKGVLAENVCRELPYKLAFSNELSKYTPQEIAEKNFGWSLELVDRDLTSVEMGIYDDCILEFDRVKTKGYIRDSVFNILQLWALMSVVSAYVIKYVKK